MALSDPSTSEPQRVFLQARFRLGVGLGLAVDATSKETSSLSSFRMFLRTGERFQVGIDLGDMRGDGLTSTMTRTDRFYFHIGARWFPLGTSPREAGMPFYRYFDFRALAVTAAAGFDEAKIQSIAATDKSSVGFSMAASIGWFPLQGQDFAIGFEIKSIGTRHDSSWREVTLMMVSVEVGR